MDNRVAALRFWHRRQSAQVELLSREPLADPLDSPAVRDLLVGLRRRHASPAKGRRALSKPEWLGIFARGFSLDATGLHHRLCFMLLTLACLRRGAATQLRVVYAVEGGRVVFDPSSHVRVLHDPHLAMHYISIRIDVDKNVREGDDEVFAYIPARFDHLSVRPVEVLLDYLLRVRPPSGSYLLSPPRSRSLPATSFWPRPYRAMAGAFQQAYRRAFPAAREADVTRVGSHSGRKSLAQWLWDAYGSIRLIADVGHWARSKDAVNIYFCSSRQVILRCLARL